MRGDGDRVLDGAAGVGVVAVDRHRRLPHEAAGSGRRRRRPRRARAACESCDLAGQELEEALQVLRVAAGAGHVDQRVAGLDALDRADDDLDAAAVLLDRAEHAHRVALREAAVEQRHVVEADGADAAGAIAELEREERRAGARAPQVLAQHREGGVDEPARPRGRGSTSWTRRPAWGESTRRPGEGGYDPPVTPRAGATVRPFRALHFDTDRVPIADAIAPPFDVVGEARAPRAGRALAVQHGAPDPAAGGRGAPRPRRRSAPGGATACCVLDDEPAYYWLEERYTRARRHRAHARRVHRPRPHRAVRAAHRAAPRARARAIPSTAASTCCAPRARTCRPSSASYHDAGAPGRAARCSQAATRSRCSTSPATTAPATGCGAAARATPRWPPRWPTSTVLIADGHHRYETALRYWRERGGGDDRRAFLPVYLANADDGLVIYPTHRVVSGVVRRRWRPGSADALRAQGLEVREVADPAAALAGGRGPRGAGRRARGPAGAAGRGRRRRRLRARAGPPARPGPRARPGGGRATPTASPTATAPTRRSRWRRATGSRSCCARRRSRRWRRRRCGRGRCRRSRPTSTRRRSTGSCSTASTTASEGTAPRGVVPFGHGPPVRIRHPRGAVPGPGPGAAPQPDRARDGARRSRSATRAPSRS